MPSPDYDAACPVTCLNRLAPSCVVHRPDCDALDDALCDALMAARQGRYDGMTVEMHLENLIERVRLWRVTPPEAWDAPDPDDPPATEDDDPMWGRPTPPEEGRDE